MDEISSSIETIRNEPDVFVKARLIKHLIQEKDIKTSEIAQKLSVDPSYVSNLLRILNLPEIIVDGYYSHVLSLSHLMVLSRLKEPDDMIPLYEQILTETMSVGKLEEVVREKLY